ncbi:hypothetical protein SFB61_08495 [Legionella pneumophila]|nr:hypothetical protein [Legionella pneumophila]MDW8907009.1 hypothetical protein [Legionella pneumophila]HAU1477912.1 hypothetical protein [Legionella pneumophila]
MTKIIFCFAGTGDPGDGYADELEENNKFGEDVIRVYLRGCQHENIGGGPLFPDLEIVANKINNAFKEDKTIDLNKLRDELGDGICRIESPRDLDTENPKIESIGLQGFSRGAVTCFAVAKKLDYLGIPMDIVANQPVPGQMSEGSASSLYRKYNDLTQCKNIRSATTFLASHNLENGVIHNKFFQQMVAKFPPQTKVNNWIMPHQSHLAWFRHWIVPFHISQQLHEAGYGGSSVGLTFAECIKMQYRQNPELYFTPKEFSQKVFGAQDAVITKDPIYLEMIQEQAKDLLENLNIKLSDEQASAIVAISKVESIDVNKKREMMNFLSEDNPKSKQFVKIVNQTHEITEYLSHVTDDKVSEKSHKIEQHSHEYKKQIFTNSYDYLRKDNPTNEEKKDFVVSIKSAEKDFAKNALNIDRGIMRKAMQIVTNFILHVTGLFLIANTINKAITGDWFLFSKTRSESLISNTTHEIAKITDKGQIEKFKHIKDELIAYKSEKKQEEIDIKEDLSSETSKKTL